MKLLNRFYIKTLSIITIGLLMFLPIHSAFAAFGLDIPDIIGGWLVKILLTLILVKLLLIAVMWASAGFLHEVLDKFVVNSKELFEIGAINDMWSLVLNMSNMVFIFVLLFIAIAIIFQGFSSYKKTLITLIFTAMLVNFSMVFTKIIIDTSNILGIGLYDKMVLEMNSTPLPFKTDNLGWFIVQNGFMDGGEIEDSDMTAASPMPGALSAEDTIKDSVGVAPDDGDDGIITKAIDWVVGGFLGFIAYMSGAILRFFINYVFYALVIYILIYIAIALIGRYISLIFIMVISPLAVASYALPKTKGIVWTPWFKELINQAFMLPILMFALLLTVKVMNMDEIKGLNSIVRYALVGGLFLGSLKLTNIFASNLAKYVGGVVGGVAFAGLAIAGKSVGGKIGKDIANNHQLGALATKGGVSGLVGRSALLAGNKLHGSAWDVRNNSMFKSATGGSFGGGQKSSFKSTEDYLQKSTKEGVAQGYANLNRVKKTIEEKKARIESIPQKTKNDIDNISELNERITRIDNTKEESEKNLEKLSKNPITGAGFESQTKGYGDVLKEIKNKRTVEAAKEAREKSIGEKFKKMEEANDQLKQAVVSGNTSAIKNVMDTLTSSEKLSLKKEHVLHKDVAIHFDHRDLNVLADHIQRGKSDMTSGDIDTFSKIAFGGVIQGNGFYSASPDAGPHAIKNTQWRDSTPGKGRIFS